ncbi:MAG: hypothetical protein K0R39_1374 [Symbiobacteriaceae bacterium]|jgi:hypothetical protein|nr:hypothetical protein [Symbiobacteriaceae bacterium]
MNCQKTGVSIVPKFEVTVEFTGRLKVDVEAEDLNAAGQKALQAYEADVPQVRVTEGQIVRIAMVV